MASFDLTFSDVYNQVSEFLGTGSSPTGASLIRAKNIVYRAYRQFLYPIHPNTGRLHLWSFLKRPLTIKTKGDQWQYQLPTDFSRMLKDPQYLDNEGYGPLVKVSTDWIRRRRSESTSSTYPTHFALSPVSQDAALGTMWELWLWPDPSGAYSIVFTYLMVPEKPTETTDLFLGGPQASEVILQLATVIAEGQEEHGNTQKAEADRLLASMVLSDTVDTPDTLGTLYGNQIVIERNRAENDTDLVYAADR